MVMGMHLQYKVFYPKYYHSKLIYIFEEFKQFEFALK
jgi:hypothetical protein